MIFAKAVREIVLDSNVVPEGSLVRFTPQWYIDAFRGAERGDLVIAEPGEKFVTTIDRVSPATDRRREFVQAALLRLVAAEVDGLMAESLAADAAAVEVKRLAAVKALEAAWVRLATEARDAAQKAREAAAARDAAVKAAAVEAAAQAAATAERTAEALKTMRLAAEEAATRAAISELI